MTFFTNDTCYNLALVTVLALVALYLIGKFFSEEKFTVYFEKSDLSNLPDYTKCVNNLGNLKGVDSKNIKFCNDSNNPVVNPVANGRTCIEVNKNVNPFSLGDLPTYNDCVLEGGDITTNKNVCQMCIGSYVDPSSQIPITQLPKSPRKKPLQGCLENGGTISVLPNGNLKCIKKTA